MTRPPHLVTLPLLVCAACSGASEPTQTPAPHEATQTPAPATPTDLPTPLPGTGVQLRAGGWEIPPGTDETTCTFINGLFDEQLAVNGSMILQKNAGHHFSVYVTDYEPDGVRPCYEDETAMTGWTLIAGNFKQANIAKYPADVAIALDPSKTLILNTHHINTGNTTLIADDTINLYTLPNAQVQHWLGSYLMNAFDFEIPPGGSAQLVEQCPIPMDLSVMALIGHMHEWGQNIQIERIDKQGVASVLYDGIPTIDDPTVGGMVTYYDAALDLHRGDSVRFTCDWFNTEDTAIVWPTEMCAVIFTYYPAAQTQLQCAKGIGAILQ